MSATQKNKEQTDEMVARVAQVSTQIRQALRAAIPAPPEQFLTLMIPGTVIDPEKFDIGPDAGDGKQQALRTPLSVQLEEAMLCDDMPAIAAIQLGPSGRSVARSYAATLGKLCPAGSTTGVSDGVSEEKLSSAEKRYQYAMSWLTGRDPNDDGRTRVEVYREKQERYTDAFERKAKAFGDALRRATEENKTSPKEQREAYYAWVAENYKTYNNLVQAAYMDWVTMGRKEELEYYFSIVDNDSAMSRVEASKECMRNSVISTSDGSAEYYKVQLRPHNWATLAKEKAAGGPVGETVEGLTYKIARLQKINFLLESMKGNEQFIVKQGDAPAETDANDTVALTDDKKRIANEYFKAQSEYRAANEAYEKAVKEQKSEDDLKPLKQARDDRQLELKEKQDNFNECLKEVEQKKTGSLTRAAIKAQKEVFEQNCAQITAQINRNQRDIEDMERLRDDLSGRKGSGSGTTTAAEQLQENMADQVGIPRAPPPAGSGPLAPDYWTSICVEVSSSWSSDSTSTEALAFSANASINYGLASAALSVSHNESHSSAVRQMANASVKISFDCLRVDITRPWLRGELFYDHDLRVSDTEHVSPGPLGLIEMMDPSNPNANKLEREQEKANYDVFPMYPTAFLLAANVVLEISGETGDIKSYMNNSSTSASASVSYGPFSASGSGARSKGTSDSTCESTATGCRITIKSPQIIGWISQILPALPRGNKA